MNWLGFPVALASVSPELLIALLGIGTSCAGPSADPLPGGQAVTVSQSFFLYCLPSPLVSDFCNLICGASVKIFKLFVMIAIPVQLLFFLGMGCDRPI